MSGLLTRPPAADGASGERQLRLLTAGVAGAAWAAVWGLVVVTVLVLAAWATDPHSASDAPDAVRMAGQVWLVSHGAPISLPAGTFALTPLGITAVVVFVLGRAGQAVARTCPVTGWSRLLGTALAVAVPYAVLAAVVAVASASEVSHAGRWQAVGAAIAVAFAASAAGMVREARLWRRGAVPAQLYAQMRAVTGALAVLVAGGALVMVLALAVRMSTAASLWEALGTHGPGALLLFALCLALLPNLVVWAMAFVCGPGFAVGAGTTVSPFAVDLGAVPALPLLGALPEAGNPPVAVSAVLLVPLVAGLVAGLICERAVPSRVVSAAVLRAAGLGVWTGLAVALLGGLAGGAVGPGRLSVVGPAPLLLGLAVAVQVGAVAALVSAWRVRRARGAG